MKSLLLFAALVAVGTSVAHAASATCEAQAIDKKLSGAARTSFIKKCDKDAASAAQKTCDAQAVERKLAGAAKTSFTQKCVRDANGATK